MKKELLYFNGLYGDRDANHNTDYIFSELIKTRSETFSWVIRPHFHSRLFQFFCVESGEVLFQGNHIEKKLSGPCLILVPPMAIHGLTYSQDVKGRILTISDSYLEAAFAEHTAILGAINKPEFIADFAGKQKFRQIQELVLQIDAEIFGGRPEQQAMIKALLGQLFINLYRLFNAGQVHAKPDSQYLQHFNNFQKLIKKSGLEKSIAEYAGLLQITPLHLNRICKSITQKPARQIVHEYVLSEAEKYLKHTSMTIAEIAYLLKFEYPNYFSKLFRKYARVTPLQFRSNNNKIAKQ